MFQLNRLKTRWEKNVICENASGSPIVITVIARWCHQEHALYWLGSQEHPFQRVSHMFDSGEICGWNLYNKNFREILKFHATKPPLTFTRENQGYFSSRAAEPWINSHILSYQKKGQWMNEWGFRSLLCTYKLGQENLQRMMSRKETFLFFWNVKARVGFEPVISGFPSRQL